MAIVRWLFGRVEKRGSGYVGWLWGTEYWSRYGYVWHEGYKDAPLLVWEVLGWHIRHEMQETKRLQLERDWESVYGDGDD